jgi:hypothetical protein
MDTVTVKVPKVFFADHAKRGLVTTSGESYVKKQLAKHYIVELSMADALELLDDARHYTECASDFDWDLQYLVSSARAITQTLPRQLAAQGITI